MGLERIPKYHTITRLFWSLVRPIAVQVAKSTKNTTVDDDLIAAMDVVMNADYSEFNDLE